MQHLTDEQLARIADETPDEVEATHLRCCAECAAELAALREQIRALAALPDLAPPPHLATRLRSELAAEGLRPRRTAGRALRIAASVALFAAGGLAGFLGRGAASAPASTAIAGARSAPPASVTEAAERVHQAEILYRSTLMDFARFGDDFPAADPVNRLAALEGIVVTTRLALNEAPADPVINGFHFTALEQRDALMEQIGLSVPFDATPEPEWF